jgi:predicted anti-sigma-YlaC factor YlaD
MMTCKEIQKLLSAYLDRELSEADQNEVAHHVDACARCQAEKKSLLTIKEVLRRQPMPAIPADLIARIEEETVFKPRWWELSVVRRLWIPALAGLAAAAGWLFLRHEPRVHQGPPLEMVNQPMPSTATLVMHHTEEKDLTQEVH